MPHPPTPMDENRETLGLGVHELLGILGAFQRRWRGRYRQTGPLPFEAIGKGSQQHSRMRQEVAKMVHTGG